MEGIVVHDSHYHGVIFLPALPSALSSLTTPSLPGQEHCGGLMGKAPCSVMTALCGSNLTGIWTGAQTKWVPSYRTKIPAFWLFSSLPYAALETPCISCSANT